MRSRTTVVEAPRRSSRQSAAMWLITSSPNPNSPPIAQDATPPMGGWGTGGPSTLLVAEAQLGAVGDHDAVLDEHVHLHDLGHAQVLVPLGRFPHRVLRRQLPGVAARPDQLDDVVRALGHRTSLPSGWNVVETATSATKRTAPSGCTTQRSRRTSPTRPSSNSAHADATAKRVACAQLAPWPPRVWTWYTRSVPPRTSGGSSPAKSSVTAWPVSRRIDSIRSSVSRWRRRRAEPP